MPENLEIERRFLVDGRQERPWLHQSTEHIEIRQWYLDSNNITVSIENGILAYSDVPIVTNLDRTISKNLSENTQWTARIRKWNHAYIFTLKGLRNGPTAIEYEWEVSAEPVNNILKQSTYPFIEKKRYIWKGEDGFLWEIDEFEGNLAGLIIAEVELEDENDEPMIPDWAGMELTHLDGWSNAALVKMLPQV